MLTAISQDSANYKVVHFTDHGKHYVLLCVLIPIRMYSAFKSLPSCIVYVCACTHVDSSLKETCKNVDS